MCYWNQAVIPTVRAGGNEARGVGYWNADIVLRHDLCENAPALLPGRLGSRS